MVSACDRLVEIVLAEAEGKALSSSDLSFRAKHLNGCQSCRVEARALNLLELSEDDCSHFAFDRASGEKIIEGALARLHSSDFSDFAPEAALASEQVSSVDSYPTNQARASGSPASLFEHSLARRLRKPILWASSIAAVAAALILFVRLGSPKIDSKTAQAPIARILLASGADGESRLSAGMAAVEGQAIGGIGETSLALGPDIVLLLEAGSRGKLSKLQSSQIEVALEFGQLHASVKPNSPGPRLAVLTKDGRAEVTGTLFSVRSNTDGSTLNVLRGSVKVIAPGQRVTSVDALKAQQLGKPEIRDMTSLEQKVALAAMRRISLLDAAEASSIQVRSKPTGARVLLDGESIGKTPLSAEVKTGHRHLVVEGHDRSAQEWIDLHAGAIAIRDYNLEQVQEATVAQARVSGQAAHRALAKNGPKNAAPLVSGETPKLSAQEMLRIAQGLRRERDWQGSANAYRELMAAYPDSAISEAALVSLGELEIEHLGDPASALRACENYLARHAASAIASEATICRIKALKALGRTSDEIRAIEGFLAAFPSAVQASQMESRLRELKSQ